ncbi:hypothetical protein [Pediococcus pentosaceus]|uniref:hypothetical protein n=1 Tax=Pediococcus pentosaceus TaxID=1255 RepID=UPI00076289D2|nr:hypothetical protein [Pediococcus pentosaceus]MCV3319169.1 hypothetical protein [Pediococcus pentosaceus]NEZ68456.1 hypothetical protein [Pediococcus pentosaceus]
MFIHMETNNKAEAIKAWLSNNRRLENQGSLAKKFGKSRSFVSLSLNKQSVTRASENLVNEIYEYLHKKYGI